MAQYRRGILNLAPGPGLAVHDPRVDEELARAQNDRAERAFRFGVSQQGADAQSAIANAMIQARAQQDAEQIRAATAGSALYAQMQENDKRRASEKDMFSQQIGAQIDLAMKQAAAQRLLQRDALAVQERMAGDQRGFQGEQAGLDRMLQAQAESGRMALGWEGMNREDARSKAALDLQGQDLALRGRLGERGLNLQETQGKQQHDLAQQGLGLQKQSLADARAQAEFQNLMALFGAQGQQDDRAMAMRQQAMSMLTPEDLEMIRSGQVPPGLKNTASMAAALDPRMGQALAQGLAGMRPETFKAPWAAEAGAKLLNAYGGVGEYVLDAINSVGGLAGFSPMQYTPHGVKATDFYSAPTYSQSQGRLGYDQAIRAGLEGKPSPMPADLILQQILRRGGVQMGGAGAPGNMGPAPLTPEEILQRTRRR